MLIKQLYDLLKYHPRLLTQKEANTYKIKKYQGQCRFYLDEYEEQDELREEWFKWLEELKIRIASLIGSPYWVDLPEPNMNTINILYSQKSEHCDPCGHFYNRFNRKQ